MSSCFCETSEAVSHGSVYLCYDCTCLLSCIVWYSRRYRVVGVDGCGIRGDVAWDLLRVRRVHPLLWGIWRGSSLIIPEAYVVVGGTICLQVKKE